MEINNHFNQYNSNNIKKENKVNPMSDEQVNFEDRVFPKVCEVLSEIAEQRVPENGIFSRVFVAFDIPNSKTNEGFLDIVYHPKDKNQRVLSTNVHHKNSDRIFSNIIMQGTKKEVMEYIQNAKNHPSLIASELELSSKVDDYYSSL